jgi:hypothetical protein
MNRLAVLYRLVDAAKRVAAVPVLGAMLWLCATDAAAAPRTCNGGNMSVASNWVGGNLPTTGDNIRINGACIVDNAFSNLAYGSLEVSRTTTGSVSWPAGGTATLNITTVVSGSAGAGTINMTNGGILRIRSGWTSTNTAFTAGAGTVIWNITSGNTTLPASIAAYNNLTIAAGTRTVNVGTTTTVNDTLTLSNGTFAVGANTLTLAGPAIAGTPANMSTTSSSSLVFTGSSTGVGLPNSVTALNNLTVNNANGVLLNSNLTLSGTLTLTSGAFDISGRTLTLNGPAIAGTPSNLKTSSTSSLAFGGSASGANVPDSVVALTNLTINNANGVVVNSDLSLSGTLALTSGVVNAGTRKITVTGNCSSRLTRTSGYVIGYLKLAFPAGATTTCTYHVGSATGYAPIALTMSTPSVTGGGTLTGSTTGAEHPQISGSGIDATKDVNRYWSLWASGDSISFTSYNATFSYVSGDKDGAANAANFVIGKYVEGSWSLPTPVTAGSSSTSVSGVTAPLTNTTDFVAGESSFTCATPSDLPSGMSCVCDSFARSTLNPSTIFDSDWIVSSSGLTSFTPRIVNPGYLRLTSNSQNVSTAATMPGIFPAAGNMITVEFKHYAYNGTGADGIALTLSDSSITPVPGAYGGSLGYAQKTGINGFAGGWIGIGIDEYGNYSTSTEGRSGGTGFALVPDSVAVRGSGSGSGSTNNYPYLAGTSTLSPGIDNPGATSPAWGHAYRITVDARCYERNTSNSEINCNNAALARKAQVSVHRDTTGAGNYTSGNRIINFDAYAVNSAQAAVPANWKLSFTGSTGSLTNIHEVAGIRICAQTITAPSGFKIQVSNSNPSTCATPGGDPSAPVITITAVDSNGNTSTSYTGKVTLSARLANGSASNAVWTKKTGGGTFDSGSGQYQFVASDNGTVEFYLTNTSTQDVYITVTDSSVSSTAPSSVQFSGGLFTISPDDSNNNLLGLNVIAGRAHRFKISRTTCSGGVTSVDTGYEGTKALDSWYNPDSDHPSGAGAPKVCVTNGSGHCVGGTGTCSVLSIAAPALSSTANNLSLSFSAGSARFCLATDDVGKYGISVRDDSNTSSPVVGSTNVLTPKPFVLAVSGIKRETETGDIPNKSGTATTGETFVAAGDTFQATVGAYRWHPTADNNVIGGDGVPDDGINFETVKSGGLAPSYKWPVILTAASPFTPAGGTAGTLANGTFSASDFVSGSATKSTLTYSEVGSFTLSAALSTMLSQPPRGFLNSSGVVPETRVFNDGGAVNAVVGRFYPDHFSLIAGSSIQPACSSSGKNSFTYMGQPFRYRFTVEARNKADQPTTKYRNSDPADSYLNVATVAVVAEDSNNGVNLSTSVTQPSEAAWNDGAYAVDVTNAMFNRPAAPVLYDALQLGVQVSGEGGAALAGRDMDPAAGGNCVASGTCTSAQIGGATMRQRFGRLKLDNAHGSELLGLTVPIRTEYWDGNTFRTNTDDDCTTIPSSSISLQGHQGGINAINMPSGNFAISGAVQDGQGRQSRGRLRLNAPVGSVNGRGSVDVCVNLEGGGTCTGGTAAGMPWLQGKWTPGVAIYTVNPVGRATFGIYKGGPIIYLREIH